MSTNVKYFQLLQQIEKNPLRPKVAAAFDVADDFKRDMERVGADRRLSAEGRADATRDLLKKRFAICATSRNRSLNIAPKRKSCAPRSSGRPSTRPTLPLR